MTSEPDSPEQEDTEMGREMEEKRENWKKGQRGYGVIHKQIFTFVFSGGVDCFIASELMNDEGSVWLNGPLDTISGNIPLSREGREELEECVCVCVSAAQRVGL